ncbi:MAG: hypothetical protein K9K75_04900 [Deltaproteobacteria bacterium]|nr:hypothetical protein [Deltaproteobacteria bacterium]
MRVVALVSLLLLVLLTFGCATKIDGLYVKDDFKAVALEQGKLVTGGVVAEPGKFELQLSSDYSNVMLAALQKERKYIPLHAYGYFFNAIGEERYSEIMQQYSKADLNTKTIEEVANAMPGIRYLALAKIDSSTTTIGESETEPLEFKNEKGQMVTKPGKIIKIHTREIVATLSIYDLASKDLAFSGQVKKSRQSVSEYEKNIVSDVVSVIGAIRGNDGTGGVYPTPVAPPIRDVLRDIFAGFGENLPKQ